VRRPEGIDLRTKEGKAWRESVAGKEIVSEPDWLRLERVWTHLQACSQVRKFLGNGHVERELFWRHQRSGIDCRAKVDQLSDGVLIDWKTTSAASEEEFINQAVNMHYDIRLAFYRDGIETVESVQRPKILVVGIQSGGGHEIYPLEITGLMEELNSEERMHRAVEDISTFVLEDYLDRPIKVATAPPWLVRKFAGELTEASV
jgi:hypothetical protein